MSILSDRLRELRGPTSQVEMARQLNMPRTQWIKYETGVTVPGSDILANICRVHSVSADWLLGLDVKSSSVRVTGDGNAVAIGSGAKASARTVRAPRREAECCAKCPHKILADAVRKAASK